MERPLTIAMVSDFFYPDVGGVESHIYMLGANLVRRGHTVVVLTTARPPDRVGVRWLFPGMKVYHIPFPHIAQSASLPNFLTFLPYLRSVVLRERVDILHAHAALSSLGHEAVLHASLLGVRAVFTDHSLFGFADAASILTNKLLAAALAHADAVICVSHTGRENTVLRAGLLGSVERTYVIPNALVADQFRPPTREERVASGGWGEGGDGAVTVVVVSRLAYRKGVDLLIAAVPRICALFPTVRFVIGGDGPKMTSLLQMREQHALQDRVELLGPVPHARVRDTALARGAVFLNTSLTEAFGIALLEAACAGLKVVSTKVGGVPEVLPPELVVFARPTEDDIVAATADAIRAIVRGEHDPDAAHARVRAFYDWARVAARTEVVYRDACARPKIEVWERVERTLELGRFAGPIFAIIFFVDCLWLKFIEWLVPLDDIDYVDVDRNQQAAFAEAAKHYGMNAEENGGGRVQEEAQSL